MPKCDLKGHLLFVRPNLSRHQFSHCVLSICLSVCSHAQRVCNILDAYLQIVLVHYCTHHSHLTTLNSKLRVAPFVIHLRNMLWWMEYELKLVDALVGSKIKRMALLMWNIGIKIRKPDGKMNEYNWFATAQCSTNALSYTVLHNRNHIELRNFTVTWITHLSFVSYSNVPHGLI